MIIKTWDEGNNLTRDHIRQAVKQMQLENRLSITLTDTMSLQRVGNTISVMSTWGYAPHRVGDIINFN